ncbi:hypothetical protein ZEAMMB73_Zm00001d047311 [Zea mays]|uniref:Uncharacterized protein n=1 Tax=Zea mays TaxID=4577 RepID=A0A1D6P8M2_MAIZE|nr:hypothetical protein ZEAMMB73_Zm00001d047311 [Zea mays]
MMTAFWTANLKLTTYPKYSDVAALFLRLGSAADKCNAINSQCKFIGIDSVKCLSAVLQIVLSYCLLSALRKY